MGKARKKVIQPEPRYFRCQRRGKKKRFSGNRYTNRNSEVVDDQDVNIGVISDTVNNSYVAVDVPVNNSYVSVNFPVNNPGVPDVNSDVNTTGIDSMIPDAILGPSSAGDKTFVEGAV